jgi:hypothetical protein
MRSTLNFCTVLGTATATLIAPPVARANYGSGKIPPELEYALALREKPAWQADARCANRTVADVAAVADPAIGVAGYDSYHYSGWLIFGGTSVGGPLVASAYALAGKANSLTGAQSTYALKASLFDVTSGSNGRCGSYLCIAGPGYDGPTGNGTPDGVGSF